MTPPGGRGITPDTGGKDACCSVCNKSGAIGGLIEGPAFAGGPPAYICAECAELWSSLGEIDAPTRAALQARIDETLSILTGIESSVIRLRHGLSDGYTYSREEVAERLGVSKDRVADIETEAIARLRSAVSGA